MCNVVRLTEIQFFPEHKNLMHTTKEDLFNATFNTNNNSFCSLAKYSSKHVEMVCSDKMDGASIITIRKYILK